MTFLINSHVLCFTGGSRGFHTGNTRFHNGYNIPGSRHKRSRRHGQRHGGQTRLLKSCSFIYKSISSIEADLIRIIACRQPLLHKGIGPSAN